MKIPQKLPPKFKAMWVAALRSGEYKQGRKEMIVTRLHAKTKKPLKPGYCCLGVGCSILGVSDKRMKNVCEPRDLYSTRGIPKLLLYNDEVVDKLIVMNDTLKYSFKKIATYIEKNL